MIKKINNRESKPQLSKAWCINLHAQCSPQKDRKRIPFSSTRYQKGVGRMNSIQDPCHDKWMSFQGWMPS